MRTRILILGAVIGSALACGAVAAVLAANDAPHAAGSAGQATTGTFYVSPSGADSSACTRAKPCRSFDRAYTVAKPGDTVLLGSGLYADPEIGYDPSKTGARCDGYNVPVKVSGCVTFEAAPRAQVKFSGDLTVIGNGVRLVGLNLGASGVGINPANVCHVPVTTGVILDGLKSDGGVLAIDAATYVADLNGDWGNGLSSKSVIAHSCDSTGEGNWVQPHHLRFDHGWYHDVVQHELTGESEHIECMHLDAADYVTISNSKFTNCAGYDARISYEHRTVENISHYLIENNIFGATCSEQRLGVDCFPIAELQFDGTCLVGTSCDSNVIRFNTIDGSFHPSVEDGSRGFTNSVFYGNLVTGGDDAFHCKTYLATGLSYSNNVFGTVGQNESAVRCGTGSALADKQLMNPLPPSYDFRLAGPRVKAVSHVPTKVPRGYPARDFAGRSRPTRWPIDAGAYQWETARIVLGRSIGAVRLGQREEDVIAFYGKPRRRSSLRLGQARLTVLTYRLHGGDVSVYIDGGEVVGVGTSSRYYSTTVGVGVGTDVEALHSWPKVNWVACRRSLARRFGSVGVYVAPSGGQKGKTIARLAMIRIRYGYGDCARS